MADLAIFNASPLIALANAGHPTLVQVAAPRILFPQAVVNELAIRGDTDPAVRLARSAAFELLPDIAIPPSIDMPSLGKGESSVLAAGLLRPGALLMLDDLAARNHAGRLGLNVRGTLWLVTEAKRQGVIAKASIVIEDLRRVGLYLPNQLIETVLRSVGE